MAVQNRSKQLQSNYRLFFAFLILVGCSREPDKQIIADPRTSSLWNRNIDYMQTVHKGTDGVIIPELTETTYFDSAGNIIEKIGHLGYRSQGYARYSYDENHYVTRELVFSDIPINWHYSYTWKGDTLLRYCLPINRAGQWDFALNDLDSSEMLIERLVFKAGRIVKEIGDSGTVQYLYDNDGRLMRKHGRGSIDEYVYRPDGTLQRSQHATPSGHVVMTTYFGAEGLPDSTVRILPNVLPTTEFYKYFYRTPD